MRGSEQPLQRTNTSFDKTNNNPAERRKIILSLQSSLKEEIEKRQAAEERLLDYRERSRMIESEFLHTIEKYDQNLAALNGQQAYSQDIWHKMQNTIEEFNRREEKILDERCHEMKSLMDRKLSDVFKKVEFELDKSKRLSTEQLDTIKADVKEALRLSRFIYEENVKLRSNTKELEFSNKVLKEEKNLLIEELARKKATLATAFMSINHPKMKSSTRPNTCKKTQDEGELTVYSTIHPETARTPKTGRTTPTVSAKVIISQEAKTSDHLRSCYEREKRRRMELGKIVSQLQNRNSQILLLLQKLSLKAKQQLSLEDKNKLLEEVVEGIHLKMQINEPPKRSSSRLSDFDLADFD